MSECKTCGRFDGHWIGCVVIAQTGEPYKWDGGQKRDPLTDAMKALTCSFDGCSEPRRSGDKRVKFCAKHSDPKNRK